MSQEPGPLHTRSDSSWVPVCTAPCSPRLEPGAVYRVQHRESRPSPVFTVDSEVARKIELDVGSDAGMAVGTGMMIAAGVAMVVGAIASIELETCGLAFLGPGEGRGGECPSGDDSSDDNAGLVIITGGALVGLIGLIVAESSGTVLSVDPVRSGEAPRVRLDSGLELSGAGLHF